MHAVQISNRVPAFVTRSSLSGELCAGCVTEACDKMVIDHADGLHERVDDRRPNELEAARNQLF
jgi:hypothetical protein